MRYTYIHQELIILLVAQATTFPLPQLLVDLSLTGQDRLGRLQCWPAYFIKLYIPRCPGSYAFILLCPYCGFLCEREIPT